jgi:hypothetical protein
MARFGHVTTRIAYHNPWKNAAENQGYMSMAAAGRAIGVEVIACENERDIEACRPDFVLCVTAGVAKITDFPTYLTVHVPSTVLVENAVCFSNFFSFDGYLTISDSLARLVRDITFGAGRYEPEPGFCYLTPQLGTLSCDWSRAGLADTLKIVYFGTNWQSRMPGLFRALDRFGVLAIHGPEAAWRRESYQSYAGPVPFDGLGPQRIYAERGIGLAIMDDEWWREDVISNRIFEISSVGAVTICQDMPWTRKWFGDSVFYFDPESPIDEMVERIRGHHAFCRAHPDIARDMGQRARAIFERHFAAEHMLRHAVAYHGRKQDERAARLAATPPAPPVTVVIRCGGRSLAILGRAIDSVRRQSYGSFIVMLAKYADVDLSSLTAAPGGAIAGFDEFLIEGGGRARMLFEGVRRVTTRYFAVLDDDDFWMSDHMETLFAAGRRVDPEFDMAYAAQLRFDSPVEHWPTLVTTRSILRFGYEHEIGDVIEVLNRVGINSFVARRDLLTDDMLSAPDMRTAEDSLLICLLAWRSKPIFSFRPTAFYRDNAEDGSRWRIDPERHRDEISLGLRIGLAHAPAWLPTASLSTPRRMLEVARARVAPHRGPLAPLAEPPPAEPPLLAPPLLAPSDMVPRADLMAALERLRWIERSTSWRLTAPLRWLVNRLRGV